MKSKTFNDIRIYNDITKVLSLWVILSLWFNNFELLLWNIIKLSVIIDI